MKTVRFTMPALLLSAALVFASCKDAVPVAPLAPAADSSVFQADLLGTLTKTVANTGLLTCSALPTASARQTIGTGGGVMIIGPHKFTVPAGALRQAVTITAVAPSGTVNRVSFQPEGLVFAKSASLEMSYANCNLLGSVAPKHIAYVTDDLSIRYLLESIDNLLAKKVTGRVDHFSDYAMAW
jgi:hypothetical protein